MIVTTFPWVLGLIHGRPRRPLDERNRAWPLSGLGWTGSQCGTGKNRQQVAQADPGLRQEQGPSCHGLRFGGPLMPIPIREALSQKWAPSLDRLLANSTACMKCKKGNGRIIFKYISCHMVVNIITKPLLYSQSKEANFLL